MSGAAHTDSVVLCEVRDGVAELPLNRPDRMNAFTPPMGPALVRPFREFVEEAAVPAVGEGLKIEGRRISLRVPRDELPAALARLLSALEVIDLAVTDPPVEEIIGALFRGEGREEPSPS